MRIITLEELLEAGCHFGHQVTRQNPKARDYIFEARDNIHIIDLAKTKEGLEEAATFVRDIAKNGGTMVMLGAKRQAEPVVREEVKRAKEAGAEGLYFVTNRWIGGILTNFSEVQKNFKRLKYLTEQLGTPAMKAKYTKKEIALLDKERSKLESFYGGIADMTAIPTALYVIDTHMEDLAVKEAQKTHIKTVGITDTNADPTMIDYAIPANDDAIGSIKILTEYIVDAWIEGKKALAKGKEQNAEGKEPKGTKGTEEERKETKETPRRSESSAEQAKAEKVTSQPVKKVSEGKKAVKEKKEEAKKKDK